jgi:hypothetical protein
MPGVFNIKISNDIVYKSLNKGNNIGSRIITELSNIDNYNHYLIKLNSNILPIIGKYIKEPLLIERNGNYTMNRVNGYNLMDLLKKKHKLCKIAGWSSKQLKLHTNICIKILIALFELEYSLYLYNKNNKLDGDWFLHNLIYDIKDQQIYNIDLEGFYSYNGRSPMCDLKVHIPRQFNSCKQTLLKKINSNIFSIILWNPVKEYFNDIKNQLKLNYNIIFDINYKIDNIEHFINKIYEFDTRCHKPFLPKKIELLQKYDINIQFMLILVDNPLYNKKNISQTAIKLKDEIRVKYKSQIDNYYKDIIIHISDNSDEAIQIYNLICK